MITKESYRKPFLFENTWLSTAPREPCSLHDLQHTKKTRYSFWCVWLLSAFKCQNVYYATISLAHRETATAIMAETHIFSALRYHCRGTHLGCDFNLNSIVPVVQCCIIILCGCVRLYMYSLARGRVIPAHDSHSIATSVKGTMNVRVSIRAWIPFACPTCHWPSNHNTT